MSRPKYAPGAPTARDTIIEAFWSLLESKPYEKMGVREVIRAAGVNKNTFYHHFRNIDDLAQQAIDSALPKEFCRLFFVNEELFREDAYLFMSTPYATARFSRIKILLSDNGVALQGRVKQKIVSVWFEALGVDVPAEEQSRLAMFLAGGLVSSLQGQDPGQYPVILSELSATKPIQAFIAELNSWRSSS